MKSVQQFSSVHLRDVLISKLSPRRLPLSAKMAAILGFLLDTTFVEPRIAEITVTSENLVLARLEDEEVSAHLVGTYSEVVGNWFAVINAAGLTPYELGEALAVFGARIGFIGPTTT
jgi:hypothetical protein